MEKMKTAERVMANGNYVLTRQLTEQEQVDTKLAAATAWSARTHQEDNRMPRQETDRKCQ